MTAVLERPASGIRCEAPDGCNKPATHTVEASGGWPSLVVCEHHAERFQRHGFRVSKR